MATTHTVPLQHHSRMHYPSTDEEDQDDDDEDTDLEDHNNVTIDNQIPELKSGFSGRVLVEPRAKWVEEWNRVFLLVCATGLFVDPLFFYALSISDTCMCLFVDGWLVITVTVLRCMTDALHIWNMWLQLKMAKRSSIPIRDTTKLIANRLFFFDLFVILPIPQIVLWIAIPSLLEKGSITLVMTVFLIMFLFQYLPKIYHSVCLLRRIQNLSGYIFGTVWWSIALNMIAYFVASHAAGACWYLLGIQRAAKCLQEQCAKTSGCGLRTLCCKEPIYYGSTSIVREKSSTFGNLESTTERIEVVFNIIVLTSGLILVTMLIGNIKVFLHATTSKKQAMQLKMRNIEWWMSKRRLPHGFRQRVRNYERQRWAAMRGVDECQMIKNLPEGLRRDIKYHLCLDLVRQVPLFQHMDDLVLENICDRVKSLVFTKGETITREGDPVQRMLFVVRGHLQSSQVLRDGVKSCCMLGPGNFSGDELLSWCLRRPFIERLPPSSCTLVTLETTEAFGLEAKDVKYVTQHFRYTFVKEKVKRSARYYSPGWRTWAAVAIQLAWRRYKHRLNLNSLSFIRPRRPASRCTSMEEDRLRLYTALLTSPKPNQDDFDF
ncbi:cyclic nucleotide-gated ion channel 4-like isoform X3 [Abrus precatorius]|uniref:Cyclic nucleotide-gated ion channel 4-like isoform X3 n=1 Tax=Abrus precatorius TaxID=3816 RepID=A0A8B8KIJ4_ABRPR|nr:cyclic nucleotide-gated ion channel 4-like isoform X3 [Abrus precatorius]